MKGLAVVIRTPKALEDAAVVFAECLPDVDFTLYAEPIGEGRSQVGIRTCGRDVLLAAQVRNTDCHVANKHPAIHEVFSNGVRTARGTARRHRLPDPNQLAFRIVQGITGQATAEEPPADGKNPAAVALGRLGGAKGGKARAAATPDRQDLNSPA